MAKKFERYHVTIRGVPTVVEYHINTQAICSYLAEKAQRSKSKKASVLWGAVQVRVIGPYVRHGDPLAKD